MSGKGKPQGQVYLLTWRMGGLRDRKANKSQDGEAEVSSDGRGAQAGRGRARLWIGPEGRVGSAGRASGPEQGRPGELPGSH